jgi:phosphoserine phosphatase
VQLQTADTIWARIEALARERPGGVVATDGDGTLWQGDVGEELFRAFLDSGRWEPAGIDAVRREARNHGLSDAGSGSEVAERIFEAYLGGQFPEERVCEIMTFCFAGWTRTKVQAFARRVVDDGKLPARLNADVVSLVERARAARIEVILVSASPLDVVVAAGSKAGFEETHVVAARARYEGGLMIADVERPIPYALGKVVRLRERVGDRLLYAALGDNVFDVAMLADARIPIAVTPKRRLRDKAALVPNIVELSQTGPAEKPTAR